MTIILTRIFSDKKEEKKKPAYVNDDADLKGYETKKGLIGSVIPGIPGILGAESKKDLYTNNLIGLGIVASGPLGRYAANKKAEELDRKGKSDDKILKKSTIHGTSVGALAGGTAGALLGTARGDLGRFATTGAILGGLGSGYGSYVSVKDRLDRRKKYADRS